MNVYVNGELRTDVRPLVGGDIGQNSDHVTDSTINVGVPVASEKQLQECDVLKIVEESGTVYAGVILLIKQNDMGFSPDLSERSFTLTLASNAYLLAKVFTDMQFPEGANATQILRGNHSGDPWYSSTLGAFAGIIATRILPEGVTLGTLDDFTDVVLNAPALLWGQPITDTLDAIASAAGAWWEITNDRIFNMRYKISRTAAPFPLDANCGGAYDLVASRDACTMYSAVRVVGGSGQGPAETVRQLTPGEHDFKFGDIEIKDATHAELKYPVHSFPDQAQVPVLQQQGTTGGLKTFIVGWKGLDDNNPNIEALVSYGGTEIELKSPNTFVTLNNTDAVFISFYYYPLIPIVVRLVDPVLSAEIVAQRGGTGVIEAVVTDNTITDFSAATQAGISFLDENAKRALNVEFKTKNPNFRPGQILPGNLPYYNVVGDYQVTETKGTLITSNENAAGVWEFTVQASTAAYRDSLKSLFYQSKKTEFKLGTDFPTNDGAYIVADLEVKTTLNIRLADLPTWAEIDAKQLTWAQIEAAGKTWVELENTIGQVDATGDYLTPYSKEQFVTVFLCSIANYGKLNLSKYGYLFDENSGSVSALSSTTTRTATGVTNIFHLPLQGLSGPHVHLKTSVNENADYTQNADIELDFPNFPQLDAFITKEDTIIAPYYTDQAKINLLRLLAGEDVKVWEFVMTAWLNIKDETGATVYFDYGMLMPLSTTTTGGDSVSRAYYIGQTQESYLLKSVTDTQDIPLNIDKSAGNPKGQYALTIVKRDRVI